MSTLVTLDRLYDEAGYILPSNCVSDFAEFTVLANRAAERLVIKGAVPGMLREIELGFDSDRKISLPTDDYYHILSISYQDIPRHIAPLTDKYLGAGVARDSFLDYGYSDTDDTVRIYEAPRDAKEDMTGETVTALVHKKYVPVAVGADTFPISAIGALKLSMVAMHYEDQGDQKTAQEYWMLSMRELEESSRQFRGPVVPSMQFFDPAMTDVTYQMY
jgi:hypothetical protein